MSGAAFGNHHRLGRRAISGHRISIGVEADRDLDLGPYGTGGSPHGDEVGRRNGDVGG